MNSRGGFIHAHYDREPATDFDVQRPVSEIKPSLGLAPLEVRNAVYSELIRLSPASNYYRELVSGSKGLLARGFLQNEVAKFGALPPEMSERDKLSYKLNRFVRKNFSFLAESQRDVPLVGIPGFWQEPGGRVRLWRKVIYERPFLIIPYRDGEGRIQACQLRAEDEDRKKRYCWLSSAGESQGVGTGDPLHFTFVEKNCPPRSPRLITEGALKGEAFVAETYGIANAMTEIVTWEGAAKGIDCAALADIRLSAINVPRWYQTLEGDSLERVKDVWGRLEFKA
jgi:hypothetical protein